ncbi:ParA family protein [Burkholderia multivorans]|uniref:ParA family protein n=1 Tax=Burkholderia multivorans TaxID=87883 RepID=UPI001C26A983|nr:ParA family protein [Burkholderia multivorans]MBU9576281.1 ParA family protein [Burkholderia multivorans]MDN7953801.1 ParA family protein [Burkholderia multivorans]MDN7999976.1 ParA family protein [Burkholderia multivorans]
MKTLAIWTQKGGVGKTALACQLAHVLRARSHRVLVIDLDSQGNAGAALLRSEKAVGLAIPAASLLMNGNLAVASPDAAFAVIRATPELVRIPEQPDEFGRFYTNLKSNLSRLAPAFDICLIDCPPSDDQRVLLALAVAGFVLSPIQLNQEAIEGIVRTLRGTRGVERVREKFNPSLQFLGIVPNMVEATALQKRNFIEVLESFGRYLVMDERGNPLRVLRRSSIAEAQELGVALLELGRSRTAARDAWAELAPVLNRIADLVMTDAPVESAELSAVEADHGA